uniref:Reverse transcriptase domain-containing protein n=1 Tax=Anolis carolinensis TaxID=28377 RepID=A0A803T0D8_ANOCA
MSEFTRQIKCSSNNVNGLNSPNKRNALTRQIKKGKFDIISFQETHISQRHGSHLVNKAYGKEFYSLDIKKKRGVVTYINNNIPAELKFKDSEGRVVAVEITIGNQKILICNIYAPNGPKTQFVKYLKEQIENTHLEQVIILGDFNGVLDTKMDKSINKRSNKDMLSLLPKNFIRLKEEFDLIDVWREKNPSNKDYTFYSHRHAGWSRIDMIWTTRTIFTKIDKISILPRDKSDHCPIEMIINYKKIISKWKFDENLLKKEEDIERYKRLSKEYFDFNVSSDIKEATIWDAYKAVIRGHLIQQKARINKEKLKKMKEIILQIERNKKILKNSPNNSKVNKELKDLKREKSRMELDQTANQLRFIKQFNFENANKPGKWLARKIRKKKQFQQVTQIKKDKECITKDEDILQEFNKFYSQLYKDDEIDMTKITQYLGNQRLEKISEQQREILNKEITENEIKKAINSLKPNKSLGPDGFSANFYKIMQDILIVHLKRLMNEVLRNKEIPDTWRDADIIAIPKEDQDTSDVRNYRPISLLNTDYKIFTCILANRFKEFLNNWINPEQTGFLPGRKMKDNVRCILDIIEYYDWNHQKEVALLSIDTEKAFDNLNWSFFKLLFKEIDIGHQFYNAVDTIYDKQRAKILINGQYTKNIKIEKGVRQGCPLSPLIFIFALEILLKNLKNDRELKGTKILKNELKYRAFADDIICVIEDPKIQLPMWITRIEEYGEIAGFRLNRKKTKILTKNMTKTNQEILQNTTGISITKKIKYLGIWLTAKNAQLLENNYKLKWKEIKQDLQKWQNLNISLLGRIATIKMNILPKMLYLFQNLPIIRSMKTIAEWNKDLSKFIWNGKKPRIRYATMTDKKDRGGFGLPNLKLYADACALTWIKDWCNLKKRNYIKHRVL